MVERSSQFFHGTTFFCRLTTPPPQKKHMMDTFYGSEDETAALALQLQISDSLELSGGFNRKGKKP